MPNLSLGTIEVFGLPAAVEAADVALKTANVQLIGYETTDGMGMVAVKIEGQVSAVLAAVAAASAAAARVSKVFATSVIARPSEQLGPVVLTDGTVGLAKPTQPLVEPVETPQPVSTSSTSDDIEPTQPLVEPTQLLVEPVETPQPLVEPVETTTSSTSDDVEPTQPLVEPVETPQPVSTSSTSDRSAAKPRAARARTRSPRTATPRTTKK